LEGLAESDFACDDSIFCFVDATNTARVVVGVASLDFAADETTGADADAGGGGVDTTTAVELPVAGVGAFVTGDVTVISRSGSMVGTLSDTWW
jgi:hypothetical protein